MRLPPGRPSQILWHIALGAASRLPAVPAYRAADLAGAIKYRIQGGRIATPLPLKELVGEGAELMRWRRRQCKQIAYADLELAVALRSRPDRVAGLAHIDGLEHLDAALEAGNGALLYSVHLWGNFTFIAALASRGYKVNVIRHTPSYLVDSPEAALVRRHEERLTRALGCSLLQMEPGNFGVAVKAANALRRNEVVLTLLDKSYSKQPIDVELLQTRIRFASGHVALAKASGAPLLDSFVYREPRGHTLRAEIGPPLSGRGEPAEIVQDCASRLAPKLLRHPHAWYA